MATKKKTVRVRRPAKKAKTAKASKHAGPSTCMPRVVPSITHAEKAAPSEGFYRATHSAGYMICDSGDRECTAKAAREGKHASRVRAPKPGRAESPEGFTYKSGGGACSGKRFARKDPDACPVQTFWQNGQMHLRFCSGQKQRGRVIPLSNDATETAQTVGAACAWWAQHLTWDGYAPLKNAPLGELRVRRSSKKRSSTKSECRYGRNKRTGACLKRARRKLRSRAA